MCHCPPAQTPAESSSLAWPSARSPTPTAPASPTDQAHSGAARNFALAAAPPPRLDLQIRVPSLVANPGLQWIGLSVDTPVCLPTHPKSSFLPSGTACLP